MERIRTRIVVEGRVQGVYFRENTRRQADELGVAGWVRNLPDGRLEAVFEGAPDAVARAVEWARTGPERAIVTDLKVIREQPTGLRGFMIKF